MSFVQLVEFSTSRIDEVIKLAEEMRAQNPEAARSVRVLACADRDRPNQYVTVAEFPSYEAAMENSNRPEVSQFAAKMAEICDGPPTFRNLDVRQTM